MNRGFGTTDNSNEAGGYDLLQVVPLITMFILVALVTALLWFINRNATESTRSTLISDALWVEQTLRFQLSTDEDAVQRLALEAEQTDVTDESLRQRMRIHLQNNPEVLRMTFVAQDGSQVVSVPSGSESVPAMLPKIAARTLKPVYSPLYTISGELLTDMSIHAGTRGTLVATISVKTLIARQIPWWITQKYAVQLVDAGNTVLSEKTRVEPVDEDLVYKVAFDPPLAGTWLSIASYRVGSEFTYRLLIGAILALSIFVMLSLLILYRHARRRRLAEARLSAEMAFRRSMEESLTVGLRARDHEGRVLYVNNAFCRMTGFAPDELIGRLPPMPYWPRDRVEETLSRHAALNAGGPRNQSFETRFCRKDGTELDIQVFEAPLIDAAGKHQGWMGSIIDITEQKKAAQNARLQEESLQRTGRLVALGEMASSLAHELNQPLAAIASYAAGSLNILKDANAPKEMVVGALEKLAVQAARAGEIIRRIQDFVRKRDPKFETVDLASVVRDTTQFLAADARSHHATIETEIETGLPSIRADRILLEQVLLNLMRNGIEAMQSVAPEKKTLHISVTGRDGWEVIEVKDHGPGIQEDIAYRIFEPFVTSKGDGMGMGLNICRTIVELHQGHLSHRHHEDGGAVFSLRLPIGQAATERAA
ncbi:sensor histidine kinase [Rhizobium sp. C4]|uniref:sensor histidine kinase n=1 Tax=Rhizobium sp. C4 TaxID=1349800 RepID=UPI001E38FD53|nr:PAS domain-containing sensor histidine kinase [Rhizobium sp. C4]MCD2172337.1 PAS domain S-box protein [Rhizobium sp. C4]